MSRAMRRAQAKAERAGGAPPPRTVRSLTAAAAAPQAKVRGGPLDWRPRFVMDIVSELRKVAWPTWQDTRYLTVVVVIMTIILGAILGAIDIGFGWLVDHTLLGE